MPLRNTQGGRPAPSDVARASAPAVPAAAFAPGVPPASGTRRVGDEAILDAARHLVLTQGMARTTLTDVAREAGLSRMTVYRRWEGLSQVLGAMMQREWDRVLNVDPSALGDRLQAASHAREFIVDEVVAAAGVLRGSELLQRLIQVEPELLLPYLVRRSGSIHRYARQMIGTGVGLGQQDGSVRAGDPELLAASVVLAVQSWVVSLDAAGAGQDPSALDAELGRLLHGYLAPDASTAAASAGDHG
jgi:AcrR family transcriptional regulator